MKQTSLKKLKSKCFLMAIAMVMTTGILSAQAIAQASSQAPAPEAPKSLRDGRIVSLDAGLGYSNGIAKFASVGYHVSPDWLVEGYYENASTVFFGHSESRAIRSKNFWSPIVYTNLSAIYRKTYGGNQFLDMMTSAFTGKETHYELSYWDAGPEFSVGSQWSWGGFHVSCDWIGVYWPIYVSKAKIKLSEDGVVSTRTRDNLKPDPSARLLRVSLGISI